MMVLKYHVQKLMHVAIDQFNREFNVITGLVNLHLLWDRIDKSPPSPDRWGTSIDWNGTAPPAKGAPF